MGCEAYNHPSSLVLETMAVIEIRNLAEVLPRLPEAGRPAGPRFAGLFNREYRDVAAVRGIDLDVEQGEFVAFLGPNGAGKTTTLKLLSGVINPTGGEARVLGYVPWQRENAYRRRFALVMGQKNQLWWDLPAAESFRLHQQIYRIDPSSFEQTHDELVDLLGRAAAAEPAGPRAVARRADEDGADRRAAALAGSAVPRRADDRPRRDRPAQHPEVPEALPGSPRQITILLTSHYMKDVAALCQRVVVINHGQIIYDGSLAGIVDSFSSHKVLTLQFGDGRMPSDLSRYGEVLELKEPRGEAARRAERDRRRAVGGAGRARDRRRERRRPAAGRSDRRSVRAGGGASRRTAAMRR